MAIRVLLVDDDAGIRDVCGRILREAGFEIQIAESGESAVSLLDAPWDIVVTDLSMPGKINGIEVLRQARARTAADVLIITASPELDTAIQAIREGAYDYLVKPVSRSVLLLAIDRCLERRRLSQELKREKALRSKLDRAYRDLNRSQRIRKTFGQFVTPQVAEFVLANPKRVWQRGERKEVTVLFADVRRFTPFAEAASPEEAVEALNEIFRCVTDAVQREGGILNKFIGDGMLALFGAPATDERHAEAGARAALRACAAVNKLAAARSARKQPPLRIGIGLNTGEVVAGCLGTNTRTEYSVIGHAVNLAARLESEAAPGQIYLGPETLRRLPDRFLYGLRNPLVLPGIALPIIATELVGLKTNGAEDWREEASNGG